jgi:hypothetical protein
MSFEITRQELTKQANDLLLQYKLTLDPKIKEEEIRIRRIIADLGTLTGLGSQNLQDVTDNGSTTTNAVTISNDITANAFIRLDGVSTQFLKADGSVDNNTYLTASSAEIVNPFLLMGA